MSSIQQINAANAQATATTQSTDNETTNSVLLSLQEALETLMSTQDDDSSPDARASVMNSLNTIGQHLKTVQEQNHSLPKETVMLYFYFLGQLNDDEVTNAELQAYLGQANNMLGVAESKNAEQQFVNAAKQYYKATHQPWWKKALGFIVKFVVPIVMVVVGVVTADPGMLLATGFMMTMSLTGATKDLGDEITKGLETFLPDNVAQLLGGILATAVNFVATLGVGAISSLETVGEEVGKDVAEEVGKDVAKKVTVNIKRALSIGLMGGSMALGVEAPQIAEGLVDLLPISEDLKKTLTAVLMVILELVAIVGSIAGGYVASTAGESDATNVLSQGMKKVTDKAGGFFSEKMPKLFEFLDKNSETIISAARYTKFGALGFSGMSQMAISGFEMVQAGAQKNLGSIEASLTKLMAEEKATQTSTTGIVQDANQMMKEFAVMISEVGNLFEIQNVAADSLAH